MSPRRAMENHFERQHRATGLQSEVMVMVQKIGSLYIIPRLRHQPETPYGFSVVHTLIGNRRNLQYNAGPDEVPVDDLAFFITDRHQDHKWLTQPSLDFLLNVSVQEIEPPFFPNVEDLETQAQLIADLTMLTNARLFVPGGTGADQLVQGGASLAEYRAPGRSMHPGAPSAGSP